MSVKRTSTHALGNHTGKWPLVSVIVPTKNSDGTIEKCLKSIVEQTYPKIEVVVVDGLSIDNTRKIVDEFKARIVTSPSKRSEARNMGAEHSKGEYLLFVDSDMELDPNVIMNCIEKIGERYDAIIVPEISVGHGFWAKCKTLEKTCYKEDDVIEAARFFRRSVFEVIGGYDIVLEAGEDWDINERTKYNGYTVGRINSLIKHDEGRLSLQDSMRKKQRYGKTLSAYKRKQPSKAKQQLMFLRAAYFRNWRKLAEDPLHACGMLIMKACEFGAGSIGFLESEFEV